jgi:glucose-1-phosphate thymidylyltransferase
LSIIIEQMQSVGINEFVLIVGYLGDKIKDYVNKYHPNINVSFVQQQDRLGTAHAINLTKDIVNNDEMFIVLGDTICEFDIAAIAASSGNYLGIKKVDNPTEFGIVEMNDEGNIVKVVEKPAIPKSNLALVGLYKIADTAMLFDCMNKLFVDGITTKGDYNLTDAIQCMLTQGAVFKSFKVDNWFDCGKKEALLESNATLLKKFGTTNLSAANFENTVILEPVTIGENCSFKNCVIGPNVSVGNNVTVENSIIKTSIISSFTKLADIVLESSLIGSDVMINGITQSLNIGDNTEIDLR